MAVQMVSIFAFGQYDDPGRSDRFGIITEWVQAAVDTSPDVAAPVVFQNNVERPTEARYATTSDDRLTNVFMAFMLACG